MKKIKIMCPECDGDGKIENKICIECKGKGKIIGIIPSSLPIRRK